MRRLLHFALIMCVATFSYAGEDAGWRHRGDEQKTLKLFDAHGNPVGPVVSYGAENGVMLPINGALVFLPVQRISRVDAVTATQQFSSTQLQWAANSGVFYSTSNCSGQAFVGVLNVEDGNDAAPTRPLVLVRVGSNVSLYIATNTHSQTQSMSSFFFPFPGNATCQPMATQPIIGWNAESTFDLTGHYPEPLRMGF
ncbi:hypothetical protein OKW49_008193 [Paraburkholderia youngii]|uniref:hypothetical protein n=1 Tax=Paraburkholderia youngii TaxID=2782701 RepID=UPI003D1FBBFB